jgi:hypothetical protein
MRESFVMGKETSLKVLPVTPNGSKIPTAGPAMTPDRNKFQHESLTGSPEPRPVVTGKKWVNVDTGKVEASPISLIDPWNSLFGDPEITGTASLQQWLFHLKDQTSWFFEQRHADLGKFPRFLGGYLGNGSHSVEAEGVMSAQFTGLACRQVNPTPSATCVTGTLTDRTTSMPFSYLLAYIRVNGVKKGYLKVLYWDVNRNIDKDFSADETDEPAVIFSKIAMVTGRIVGRLEDTSLIDDSLSGIECSIDWRIPQGLGQGVFGVMPTCIIHPARIVTNGSGLVTFEGNFDAYARGPASQFSGQTRSRFWVTDVAVPTLTYKIKTDLQPAGVVVTAMAGDVTPDLLATRINGTVGLAGIASVERMAGETGGVLVLTAPTAGAAGYVQVDNTSTGAIQSGMDSVQHFGLDNVSIVVGLLNKVAA